MKYIRKSEEPESSHKWKALANETGHPLMMTYADNEKPDVCNELLQEQGYTCCYCGMRIARENSHIEHLKPQSFYPHLALSTQICWLHAKEKVRTTPTALHWGHKKMTGTMSINGFSFR
jgi:uncharacterized protein (TIGR02646 family)